MVSFQLCITVDIFNLQKIPFQDNEKAIARARRDFLIRHHLDRTTGVGELYF